jgi:predicted nucleic acid-binding protein
VIVLDTNVLSAIMQRQPDIEIVRWLDSVNAKSIWITSITLFEIRYGLELLPEGKRRNLIQAQFEDLFVCDLESRLLLFDQAAAELAAELAAHRKHTGRTVDMRDTFIAGICISMKATLATRNVRHFNDLKIHVLNPWSTIDGNGL